MAISNWFNQQVVEQVVEQVVKVVEDILSQKYISLQYSVYILPCSECNWLMNHCMKHNLSHTFNSGFIHCSKVLNQNLSKLLRSGHSIDFDLHICICRSKESMKACKRYKCLIQCIMCSLDYMES